MSCHIWSSFACELYLKCLLGVCKKWVGQGEVKEGHNLAALHHDLTGETKVVVKEKYRQVRSEPRWGRLPANVESLLRAHPAPFVADRYLHEGMRERQQRNLDSDTMYAFAESLRRAVLCLRPDLEWAERPGVSPQPPQSP